MPLTAAVHWPTPRTQNRNSRRALVLNDQFSAPALEQACELANGQLPREYEDESELPPVARRMWPTPKSRDYRSGGLDTRKIQARIEKRRMSAQSIDLTDYTVIEEMRDSEQFIAAVGTLNPSWVEALQGFPQNWTDISGPQAPANRSTPGSQYASQAA